MDGISPEQFTNAVRGSVLSRKNYNKIFCIGYNKTGTTTLELVLRLYGFHLPLQQEQEIRLTCSSFSTDYTEFAHFVGQYDAFQDMPFSQGQTYVVADALFPNSKFILSERDPESWFESMTSYHKKTFRLESLDALTESDIINKFDYLYPGYMHQNKQRFLTNFVGSERVVEWEKLYDKDYYIEEYTRRNNQIKKYFMGAQDKLLIIDVTQESSTEKICRFLNIPDEFAIGMPQANKT